MTTDWQTLTREEARLHAYRLLLALPDPPDLAGKRHYHYRYPGDKVRQERMHVEFRHAHSTWLIHNARTETNGVGEEKIICVRRFAIGPGERRFALRSGREVVLRRES